MGKGGATALFMGLAVLGLSAGTEAAHAAKPRQDIASWLKQCDTDELACENRMLKVSYDKVGCFPSGDDADSYTLTPKVRAWFASHPEHTKDPINKGIIAAVKDLYPCHH